MKKRIAKRILSNKKGLKYSLHQTKKAEKRMKTTEMKT